MLPGHQVIGDRVLFDELADRRSMFMIQLTLSCGWIGLFVVARRGDVVLFVPESETIFCLKRAIINNVHVLMRGGICNCFHMFYSIKNDCNILRC